MWCHPRERDPEGRLRGSNVPPRPGAGRPWPVLLQGDGGWRAGLDLPPRGKVCKDSGTGPTGVD